MSSESPWLVDDKTLEEQFKISISPNFPVVGQTIILVEHLNCGQSIHAYIQIGTVVIDGVCHQEKVLRELGRQVARAHLRRLCQLPKPDNKGVT